MPPVKNIRRVAKPKKSAPKRKVSVRPSWNKENCIREAKKYEYKTDFIKGSPGAYVASKRLNCVKEVTGHLKVFLNRHWTKETCKLEALKYTSRKDFGINSKGAYIFSGRRGWRDEICEHMKSDIIYWNFDLVKKEAYKYRTRGEFARECGSGYGYATKNGLLDKICKHMIEQGNLFNRMIYSYEFSDKFVYVGLTYNQEKRRSEHLNDDRGPVAKHIEKTGLRPRYKQLSDFIIVKEAKKNEQKFIEKYRKEGWKILNSSKAGALGGNARKWTKEECIKVAKLYNRRIDFHNSTKHYTAYSAATKNGWTQEVCKHMPLLKNYWNKKNCLAEARKYKRRSDFMRKSGGAYNYAKLHGFLEDACSHMRVILKSWTKEECNAEAKKHWYRSEFEKNGRGAYTFAQRRGWLADICSHMRYKLTYWDKNKCAIEATKYKSRKAFQQGCGSAYRFARVNGLLDEIGIHFIRPNKEN